MTTVLVTGATGYIGSHVCKKLKQEGYKVVGVDLVERAHTLKFMDEFINDDFNSVECFDTLKRLRVNAIVHCAGDIQVAESVQDPAKYYVNNVAKTINFLDVVRRLPQPPVFVFSSSAAVYGAPDTHQIYENASWNPLSPYGQTKAMTEIALADIGRAYHIPVMNLRYFNACGADLDGELGQAPGATHIFARLLESVRDKKEFTLYGTDYSTPDGSCVRDYVHVNDLAEAHMLAIQYLLADFPSCSINLGTGQGYSNKQVIEAVTRLVGEVKVVEAGRRAGDPNQLVAATELAHTYLDWTPKHSDLDTIINSAWKWYNNPSQSVDNSSK